MPGPLPNRANSLTATSPNGVEVGEASAEILKANETREGHTYVNASSSAIYLGLGKAAVVGKGIYLGAGGGSWDGLVGHTIWLGSVFAIAVSGSANKLTVVEV
jgi:hypothetical protein